MTDDDVVHLARQQQSGGQPIPEVIRELAGDTSPDLGARQAPTQPTRDAPEASMSARVSRGSDVSTMLPGTAAASATTMASTTSRIRDRARSSPARRATDADVGMTTS